MRQLPAQFIDSLRALGSEADVLRQSLAEGDPAVAVRINCAKGACPSPVLVPVEWCPDGYRVPSKVLFAADPAWHQGMYYVQEPSSMAASAAMARLMAMARNGTAPLRVLDACAAPGGKTIGIIDCLSDSDLVVANEYDPHRCNILLENLSKRGAPNVAVSRGDARAYGAVGETFDIIAADVPCSGEGMMRKEEVAVQQWSPALVSQCAQLQAGILQSLWAALKPGGYLLYSTCTFNTAENEENISRLIRECGAESVDLGAAPEGAVGSVLPGIHAWRMYPGRVQGEGQFIAAVRKPMGTQQTAKQRAAVFKAVPCPVPQLIVEPENYIYIQANGIEAVAREHAAFLAALGKQVHLARTGLPVAEAKGREFAPAHELAMSTVFRAEAMPAINLNRVDALQYLRGNAINELPEGIQRAYAAVLYGGVPLGLAKCVGRRANNLYPAQLRLRLQPQATDFVEPQILQI